MFDSAKSYVLKEAASLFLCVDYCRPILTSFQICKRVSKISYAGVSDEIQ